MNTMLFLERRGERGGRKRGRQLRKAICRPWDTTFLDDTGILSSLLELVSIHLLEEKACARVFSRYFPWTPSKLQQSGKTKADAEQNSNRKLQKRHYSPDPLARQLSHLLRRFLFLRRSYTLRSIAGEILRENFRYLLRAAHPGACTEITNRKHDGIWLTIFHSRACSQRESWLHGSLPEKDTWVEL